MPLLRKCSTNEFNKRSPLHAIIWQVKITWNNVKDFFLQFYISQLHALGSDHLVFMGGLCGRVGEEEIFFVFKKNPGSNLQ